MKVKELIHMLETHGNPDDVILLLTAVSTLKDGNGMITGSFEFDSVFRQNREYPDGEKEWFTYLCCPPSFLLTAENYILKRIEEDSSKEEIN